MTLHVPVGIVDKKFIADVEKYQKKSFISLGYFDLDLFCRMTEMLSDETLGEIELLVMPESILPDKSVSALLVAKYDGENYIALAGYSQ